MRKLTTLRVEGMDCADEVAALQRALKPVAGIREFKANLMAGKVTIAHEKKLSTDDLIQAVRARKSEGTARRWRRGGNIQQCPACANYCGRNFMRIHRRRTFIAMAKDRRALRTNRCIRHSNHCGRLVHRAQSSARSSPTLAGHERANDCRRHRRGGHR